MVDITRKNELAYEKRELIMNYIDNSKKYSKLSAIIESELLPCILLLLSTVIALIIANTSFESIYNYFFYDVFIFSNINIYTFINDFLMAIFFLVVGCEIKKEIVTGSLSQIKKAAFPIVAAIGGVIVPAIIYFLFNIKSGFLSGLGIPISTDIAFALGAFMIFKDKLNDSLKIFLLTVAIIDDLIAIVVIGIFYSKGISFIPLLIAVGIFILLLNLKRIDKSHNLIPYFILGLCLWLFVYISGINPTISGVLLALALPLTKSNLCEKESALERIEHRFSPIANLIILPLFALSNTAIKLNINDIPAGSIPVALGIILGLVLGKPLGIMLFTSIGTKLNLIEKPTDVTWGSLYSVATLTGIGFTMSIFVSEIAFATNLQMLNLVKISILLSALITCLVAAVVINYNNRFLKISVNSKKLLNYS